MLIPFPYFSVYHLIHEGLTSTKSVNGCKDNLVLVNYIMDTHLHGRSTTWLSSTTGAAAAHFNILKAAGCFVRTVNMFIFSQYMFTGQRGTWHEKGLGFFPDYFVLLRSSSA